MTKNEAIHIASKFLMNVYHDDNGDFEKLVINAHILTAEADKDAEYLCGALKNIVTFCNKLINAMKGD